MNKFIGVTALAVALVTFGSWNSNATAAERATRTITHTQTRESTTETHATRDRDLRDRDSRNQQELRDDINARYHELALSIRGLNQHYAVMGVQNAAGTAAVGGSQYGNYVQTRSGLVMLDGSGAIVSVPSARTRPVTIQDGSYSRTTYPDGSVIIERN